MNCKGVLVFLAAALWTFFGPPLAAQCTADAYEEDDACIPSKTVIHGGDTQSHNFCQDAEDWLKFNACAGRSYTIDAVPIGPLADVALELYDTDCASLLDSNYGGAPGAPASIMWTAPAGGTYHIKVRQFDATFGDNRNYDLTLTGDTSPCATWMRTYGGARDDTVFSMQQTSDGGFIATGRSNSSGTGDDDCWVLKLDASGNIEWQKTYGGADFDAGYSVQQTSDGGFVVGGETQSFGAGGSEFWVLKLDASGAAEWQKAYGGASDDYLWLVQQTSDDGFVMAGVTHSFGAGGADAWVLKLYDSGSIEWQYTYGNTDSDYALSVQQTSDDGYVVGGHTWSFGEGDNDFWILKLYDTGDIEWQRAYGGLSEDWGYFAQQTSDDGFVITGETKSFGAGGSDLWILKLNDSGNIIQWENRYGDLSDDAGWRIRQTSDGGFIAGGDTQSFGAGGRDFWTLKLDASGGIQWERAHGGAAEDIIWSPREATDGGFASAGWVYSFGAGLQDGWILKLDSNGNTDPSCTFVAETTADVTPTAAAIAITDVTPVEDPTVTVTDTSVGGADSAAVINMQCTSTPYLEYDSLSSTDCGNGDSVVDPGETITLDVTVQNVGVNNASKVSGALSTATPGIAIPANSASFPDISVGLTGTSLTPFQFVVSSGVSCGTPIDFTLALSYEDGGGSPFSNPIVFQVRVGSGTPLSLLSENFEAGLPGTWTVINGGTNMFCGDEVCMWTDLDPCSLGALPGTHMIVNSDCAGPMDMDEQLITPPIDCSSSKTVELQFEHDFVDWDFEVAEVKVRSANTGGAWVTRAKYTKAPASGTVVLDITAEAAGVPDLEVNWHYYNANWEMHWAVDEVDVKGMMFDCSPAVCGCGALPDEPSSSGMPEPLVIPAPTENKVIVENVTDETGYVVYEGAIGAWDTPARSCLSGGAVEDLGATVRINHAMDPGDRWVVVSAASGCGESSCGADSDGAGRSIRPGWPATGPCP
ncbi:MAG: hypothetical protein JSV08_04300 [Acidobacteriota bacterium]|nr:MAG: hypothetical protein JSV08_04300 [Acidobacteriota bacterium]